MLSPKMAGSFNSARAENGCGDKCAGECERQTSGFHPPILGIAAAWQNYFASARQFATLCHANFHLAPRLRPDRFCQRGGVAF